MNVKINFVTERYIRNTFVYKDYFWDFYNSQKQNVQDKIDIVIGLVRTLRIVPEKFLKHLEGTD